MGEFKFPWVRHIHSFIVMPADEEVLLLALLVRRRNKKKSNTRQNDIFKERQRLGAFKTLVQELFTQDDKFFNYFACTTPARGLVRGNAAPNKEPFWCCVGSFLKEERFPKIQIVSRKILKERPVHITPITITIFPGSSRRAEASDL